MHDPQPLSPDDVAIRQRMAAGRKGGLTTSMRHHPSEYTASGLRAANSLDRFLQQVDPNHTLPEHERTRRALAARKLFYSEIGRKGGRSARKR
jgi:general stress protein YciG